MEDCCVTAAIIKQASDRNGCDEMCTISASPVKQKSYKTNVLTLKKLTFIEFYYFLYIKYIYIILNNFKFVIF